MGEVLSEIVNLHKQCESYVIVFPCHLNVKLSKVFQSSSSSVSVQVIVIVIFCQLLALSAL